MIETSPLQKSSADLKERFSNLDPMNENKNYEAHFTKAIYYYF